MSGLSRVACTFIFNFQSTFSLDGEKLAQIQKGDVDSYITREVNSEDKMILVKTSLD